MAKSRKGKTKRFAITCQKRMLNIKFKECPKEKRKELFLSLVDWGKSALNEEQQEIFFTALYEAESTQEVQMEIGLEKALANIRGE